jgi:hypothetical protein
MAEDFALSKYRLPEAPSGPSALYYPHIHFRSRRWLRMALLYYENLSRIVPTGFEPETPHAYASDGVDTDGLLDDVRELRSIGFIRDEPPGLALPSTTNEFFDFYTSNLADPQKRAALIPTFSRPFSRQRFYTIHPAKIDPALLDLLEQAQDAHRKAGDPYSDWNIEPIVGAFYMLFLAAHMAGKRPLVSDNSVYQSLLFRKPEPEGGKRHLRTDGFRLATAVIESVVPADLENVPLDKLLRLRTESFADRQRFQDRMSELGKELAGAKSEDEFQDTIERVGRKVRDEVAVARDRIRSLNITTGTALFSLSLPSWATATWGLGLSGPVLIAGLGAIALSGALLRYRFENRIAQTTPYNYLLRASDLVTAESLAKDITSLNLHAGDDDDDDRIQLVSS